MRTHKTVWCHLDSNLQLPDQSNTNANANANTNANTATSYSSKV